MREDNVVEIEVAINGIADCIDDVADFLRETRPFVEKIAGDLRRHAELFDQHERLRASAASLNSEADLLNQACLQLRRNLNPMSYQ